MSTLKALHASWVLPVAPPGGVLEDHTVVIADDRIRDILPTDRYHQERAADAADVEDVDLTGHALLPGLVNAHTHAGMSLFRGMADDMPLMAWLEQHIWPTEARVVSAEFVRDGTRLAAAEMLLGGTTCFNDMYFFPDEGAAAAIETGIRVATGLIVIGFPSAWARDVDEYFHKGQAVHDRFRAHPLVTSCFAPHAPYTVDDATLVRIATLAEEMDVPIHMHVHETEEEIRHSVDTHGVRPLARLERLGLLSPRLVAVHMTHLDDHEIELVARHGVSVAHCPESNLKLASGFCSAAALLDAGVNLAIGTDGAASNNDHDMLGEMRSAALLAKAVAGDARAMQAAQALECATLGGARALGLEERIGSISVDKLADLVAVDLDRPRTLPVHDALSQVVYSAGADQVSAVWVGGRQVVADGHLTTVDGDLIRRSAATWRSRIADRA